MPLARASASGFRRPASASALLLLVVACSAEAAGAQSPDSIRALNRAGQWAEAARLAEQALVDMDAGAGEASLRRGCELAYHLAYASARLGRMDQATFVAGEYDGYRCDDELAQTWVPAEMARLRTHLGTSPPGARGRAGGSNADDFWRAGDPVALGMDTSSLTDHRELCEATGADACVVVRRGRIVQEWYSPRYAEPIGAMSTTKSIAGLIAGMLVDDGRLDLDSRVCDWIDSWCEGRRGRVTVRHLLSMTSGLPRYEERSVGFEADKNAFVLALEPEHEPGTRWAYSNEGVQLLEPILDAAAGQPIQDYARERLFEPLGMLDTRMKLDVAGHAWTYADLETTARDLARIGLLMLAGGEWQGRRILSEDWIRQSTQPSQQLYADYGFLWWLHPDEPRGYAGHGHLDTDLHVYPELDLVVVRMQARAIPGLREGTYDRLLPAVVARMMDE